MRLGIISNPLSGGNRKGLAAIEALLARRPEVLHREAQNPDDAAAVVSVFADKNVDVIAVNGGDGTIQAVLTALFRDRHYASPPLLAVLRSGTDSVIAEDVGLRGSRDRGLRRLLDWLEAPAQRFSIQKRPVLRVRTASDRNPRYGLIFGAAAVYQGIEYCKRHIHALGLHGEIAPSLTLARFLLAAVRRDTRILKPVTVTVRVDQDPPQQSEYLLIYISTLERLFLGLRPHWGKENAPLHFTAMNARPRHFLRALPYLARGRTTPWGTPENGYSSRNAHRIQLTMDSGFILDGECYRTESHPESIIVDLGGTATFLRL
ncbi:MULTISPECIES: diacylglycerol/lipid kinase family protein [Desulfococcus]|uniref:Diacylglycerol kinase catalytic region n=1 Tax=Desulfococcus multivorans DSM 2059 TaxID=1121405 RepID=S7TW78_DESML|nr:acylglycerol kinase family protein [Desulfococcus multivorans]AOY58131.1 diacylglycerol kinase, catalytic region [Desulfococcus multivorans]EPR41302.1 diacylglycerol kinase catalytic region [Desulfococcus multivorans DSM 2059]SJZ73381.1 Diacylglycerol kinase catalytic domain-containing protein [Desulfococcus multivorans DSM 2059]